MNDREQVLLEREQRAHGYSANVAQEPDITAWAMEKAARARLLYEAFVNEGFDEQQALLLTGRLFDD